MMIFWFRTLERFDVLVYYVIVLHQGIGYVQVRHKSHFLTWLSGTSGKVGRSLLLAIAILRFFCSVFLVRFFRFHANDACFRHFAITTGVKELLRVLLLWWAFSTVSSLCLGVIWVNEIGLLFWCRSILIRVFLGLLNWRHFRRGILV